MSVLMIRINLITQTINSLIKVTQIFIYFRKRENIWLSDAHNIIDKILYLLTVHITNNKIIVLVIIVLVIVWQINNVPKVI